MSFFSETVQATVFKHCIHIIENEKLYHGIEIPAHCTFSNQFFFPFFAC